MTDKIIVSGEVLGTIDYDFYRKSQLPGMPNDLRIMLNDWGALEKLLNLNPNTIISLGSQGHMGYRNFKENYLLKARDIRLVKNKHGSAS